MGVGLGPCARVARCSLTLLPLPRAYTVILHWELSHSRHRLKPEAYVLAMSNGVYPTGLRKPRTAKLSGVLTGSTYRG